MDKKILQDALTETTFYILLRLHKRAHGYAIMKDISEMTEGRVKFGAGTLYGALDTLQKKDWICRVESESEDRKKEYIITKSGKIVFEKEVERLQELLSNSKKIEEIL